MRLQHKDRDTISSAAEPTERHREPRASPQKHLNVTRIKSAYLQMFWEWSIYLSIYLIFHINGYIVRLLIIVCTEERIIWCHLCYCSKIVWCFMVHWCYRLLIHWVSQVLNNMLMRLWVMTLSAGLPAFFISHLRFDNKVPSPEVCSQYSWNEKNLPGSEQKEYSKFIHF